MKKWIMLLGGLCLTACLLAGCGEKGEDQSSSSTVSTSQASTDSEILGLADNGDMLPLLVEEEKDGWYQIEYQGKPAYVSAEYATVQEVTLEEYNQLRAGGDTSSASSSSETSSTASTTSEPSSSSETSSSAETTSTSEPSSSSSDPAGDLQDGE